MWSSSWQKSHIHFSEGSENSLAIYIDEKSNIKFNALALEGHRHCLSSFSTCFTHIYHVLGMAL